MKLQKRYLSEAYWYIREDSLQNAEMVRAKIPATIKELPKNPLHHATYKYRKKNEDGAYLAYEVYSYRITYHISTEEIRIIRIRHTKMNPLEY